MTAIEKSKATTSEFKNGPDLQIGSRSCLVCTSHLLPFNCTKSQKQKWNLLMKLCKGVFQRHCVRSCYLFTPQAKTHYRYCGNHIAPNCYTFWLGAPEDHSILHSSRQPLIITAALQTPANLWLFVLLCKDSRFWTLCLFGHSLRRFISPSPPLPDWIMEFINQCQALWRLR